MSRSNSQGADSGGAMPSCGSSEGRSQETGAAARLPATAATTAALALSTRAAVEAAGSAPATTRTKRGAAPLLAARALSRGERASRSISERRAPRMVQPISCRPRWRAAAACLLAADVVRSLLRGTMCSTTLRAGRHGPRVATCGRRSRLVRQLRAPGGGCARRRAGGPAGLVQKEEAQRKAGCAAGACPPARARAVKRRWAMATPLPEVRTHACATRATRARTAAVCVAARASRWRNPFYVPARSPSAGSAALPERRDRRVQRARRASHRAC